MAISPEELENVFAKVNNEVDYESIVVPPRVNATSFKIDGSIYMMLKAEIQFHNSIPLSTFKEFLGVTNNVVGGYFIDKTFNWIANILDKTAKQNHAWIEEIKVEG
ncbi:hypothetical protein HAX54_053450 [Datura stramonium]|uniref:Uncharacterized protein n=1 Tax=Datura stramonium TaxID=4076 RepID=A0ABS8T0F6_DATST|nr:hypothetical protein [Datura stramonium]